MTRGRVCALATALVALVAATAAMAAGPGPSVRLSGHVQGDKDSIVRLSIVSDDGQAKTAAHFRFKKILATCDGVEQRISLKLTGRIPVEKNSFKRSFGDRASGFVKVKGTVKRSGTRVVGTVRSSAVPVLGVGACNVDPVGFTVHD